MQRQGGHMSRWTWFAEEDCKKRQTTLGQINDDHDDDGETGKKRKQNLKTWKQVENLTAILKIILIKQMMVSDKQGACHI